MFSSVPSDIEAIHARDAVSESRRVELCQVRARWDAYAIAAISSMLRGNPNFELYKTIERATAIANAMVPDLQRLNVANGTPRPDESPR